MWESRSNPSTGSMDRFVIPQSQAGSTLYLHDGGTPESLHILRASLSGISVWRRTVDDPCAPLVTNTVCRLPSLKNSQLWFLRCFTSALRITRHRLAHDIAALVLTPCQLPVSVKDERDGLAKALAAFLRPWALAPGNSLT